MQVYYRADHVVVRAIGNNKIIVQVLHAFAWISCAARAGPAAKGVWESIPICTYCSVAELSASRAFVVHFLTRPIQPTTQPGTCWQHVFQGAVIARGFPIPQRATVGLGLEMPLNMMAALGGSHRLTQWDDRVFIKGFSTMLVTIKSTTDILVWHYYYSRPGERLSYMDCTQQTEKVNMARFSSFRHVIGWCSSSKYYAGKIPQTKRFTMRC